MTGFGHGAVEHGEQNSHLNLAPQTIRDILNRIGNRILAHEAPVLAITSSGSRYFLRQMVEPALPNLFVAAGFFKMGITLAPLAARTVVDLLFGQANEPLLDLLSPARFLPGKRNSPRER